MTYSRNPEPIKYIARERSAVTYSQNPEPLKERAREHLALTYSQNPLPQQKRAREFSAKSYKDNLEPKKLKSRESYEQNSDSKKNNALKRYHDNRKAIFTLLRNDYVKNKYSKRAIARLRILLTKKIESVSTEHIMKTILIMCCIECVQIMHCLPPTMRPKNITMTK